MTSRFKDNWPWFVVGIGLLLVLYALTPILTPFVVAAGLAYVGDPIVDWLERRRLSRTAGVCIVFVVITTALLLLLVLVAPLLQEQLTTLIHNIPDWLNWMQDVGLPRLGIVLPEGVRLDAAGLKTLLTEHWSKAGGVAAAIWARVSGSGGALLTTVANMLLVPVVAFYLLRDWDRLVEWIAGMVPRRTLPKISELARETDDILGAFLRGQLTVMAVLGLVYWIGLSIVGVNLALLIALVAGLTSFVPYLGFIMGFGLAAVAVLVQTQELLPLVWVGVVFGIGQLLESMVLTPLLVGDKIGMHPVAVIFAVMAGGQLFGFVGVLMALPVAAVLSVMLTHAKAQWLQSGLYQEPAEESPNAQDFPPP